jgi:hypothetical protein
MLEAARAIAGGVLWAFAPDGQPRPGGRPARIGAAWTAGSAAATPPASGGARPGADGPADPVPAEGARTAGTPPPPAQQEPGKPPLDGWEALLEERAIVLSFPLYVDMPPAPLLEALERLAAEALRLCKEDPAKPLPRLYAIINNGFFDPRHCETASGALRLFCRDTGLVWSGVLMAGGGPMVAALPRLFRLGLWPFGRLKRGLASFAGKVKVLANAGEAGLELPMPRRLYVFLANTYWRLLAARNMLPPGRLRGPVLGPGEPAARDRGGEA